MNIRQYAIDFAATFALALSVNLIVAYLYGLAVHGSGVLEWEKAFTFAISFGIIFSWARGRKKDLAGK